MRLLLKFPTRSRPQQAMQTIKTYFNMATRPDLIGVAMSCDVDDEAMNRPLVQDEFATAMRKFEWSRIFYGNSKCKIEACNANVNEVDYPWDIIMLVSDDMVPQIRGYDDVIRSHMMSSFPDTDGILWFSDGHQEYRLNTLSIMGRKMYQSLGTIYEPVYRGFFCDTEFTDLCTGRLKDKCIYVPSCIIRHEHPGNGYRAFDALYIKNQEGFMTDADTYISRKTYMIDWTILIPTIPGREEKLKSLINTINELHARVCPNLKIKVTIGFDNREKTIGAKRQQMLEEAQGKYVSFIDDDDRVTQAYFEDAAACIAGNYDCMRLRGQIAQSTFTHSIVTGIKSPMANNDTFLRPPNHLNPMKTDIAKLVRFRDVATGEDFDWTFKLARVGFLRTEYRSDESRIHYIYDLGDRTLSPKVLESQRGMTLEQSIQKPVQKPVAEPQFRLGPRGFART